LEQYTDALTYALGAGKFFDVAHSSEYVDTIVGKFSKNTIWFTTDFPRFFFALAKCIDEFIRLRQQQVTDATVQIDNRLEKVVLDMFNRCFTDKRYKQALGIALEARRLDKIEQAIANSDDLSGMLSYCLKVSTELVLSHSFRRQVCKPFL
jgi:26S proteasome regulatory subunit N2